MVRKSLVLGAMLAGVVTGVACAADAGLGYQDTPMLPGNKWHVHDGERPQPTVVTPVTPAQAEPAKAPSDAIVLFDGQDLNKWKAGNGQPSGWKVDNGAMVVPPAKTPNGGNILTREEFGDCQLHLEFCEPQLPPNVKSQGRGNSGVFLMGRYEIQVLDSYQNPTYADGSLGAVYGQHPPLVNAALPPGTWQTYDITFTAPRYKDGKVATPAYVTVILNGVVVQNHAEIYGETGHRVMAQYRGTAEKGPLMLQDHGNPVKFRNIWVRPIKAEE